ncbi:hypothetical protein [Bacillus solitudinis]|uniref:hypothetical protein n=1 Tax=Bacillus solitudinis TaxID=2014074 RepID=UPI000C250CBE|nr:hypothetical protein [Bacillus solitudinis]
MISLLNATYAMLASQHSRVYYEVVRKDPVTNEPPPYPYVVYNFATDSTPSSDAINHILEVDIWDRPSNGDQTTIETLTDQIDKHLRGQRVLDVNQLLIFTRISKLPLNDPDHIIKRRQLRYQIKRYER